MAAYSPQAQILTIGGSLSVFEPIDAHAANDSEDIHALNIFATDSPLVQTSPKDHSLFSESLAVSM